MNWHWQNLNEDRRGNVKGSGFWNGRAWLNFGKPFGRGMRIEWQFGRFMFRLQFTLDPNEREMMFSFAIPGISFYLSAEGFKFLRKLRDERQFGVTIHDWAFWWSIWESTMSWNSKDPWWMRGTFHIDTFFLGKMKVESKDIESKQVFIPMPEGVYPANAKIVEVTYKRSRWLKRIWNYVDLDIPGGIPFEGKGENSWDCEEDGLFGMSSNGTSYEDAIGKVVASVLTSRRKYGLREYPSPDKRVARI